MGLGHSEDVRAATKNWVELKSASGLWNGLHFAPVFFHTGAAKRAQAEGPIRSDARPKTVLRVQKTAAKAPAGRAVAGRLVRPNAAAMTERWGGRLRAPGARNFF